MDTKPVSIESVFKSGELVRFFSVTNPLTFEGYEKVEEVTTDANGVATLTATPPAGKVLCAVCHIVDSGTAYTRFRVLTDNY